MKTNLFIIFAFFSLGVFAQKSKLDLDKSLKLYKDNLAQLRQRNTNIYQMPAVKFFLFGMGERTKYIYKGGQLKESMTGKVVHSWLVKTEMIVPNEYTIYLETVDGKTVSIYENEKGIFIKTNNDIIALSQSRLILPEFSGKKYAPILKVLHHEIIINVLNGKPLPNYFVYSKPWNRDAAMMAMVMEETGNLDLIKNWVLSLTNPFDYNNKGISEADNPGEVLYLLSLSTDKNNPLVKSTLDSAKKFIKSDHIEGKTDFGNRPVFQTKWLKYGLKSLDLKDNYIIPKEESDNYSALFWWDYKDEHVYKGRFNVGESKDYPYLTWAEDHFYGEQKGFISNEDYPLSWERNACCANYSAMKHIDPVLADLEIGTPHTWHAAEMFLLLINE